MVRAPNEINMTDKFKSEIFQALILVIADADVRVIRHEISTQFIFFFVRNNNNTRTHEPATLHEQRRQNLTFF